jgi:hypothetical protein
MTALAPHVICLANHAGVHVFINLDSAKFLIQTAGQNIHCSNAVPMPYEATITTLVHTTFGLFSVAITRTRLTCVRFIFEQIFLPLHESVAE